MRSSAGPLRSRTCYWTACGCGTRVPNIVLRGFAVDDRDAGRPKGLRSFSFGRRATARHIPPGFGAIPWLLMGRREVMRAARTLSARLMLVFLGAACGARPTLAQDPSGPAASSLDPATRTRV